MASHRCDDVRSIAFVGHATAGKTTLADTLLFQAHAVDRKGSVDDGTSISDYDEEEHKRHFSIDAHLLHAEHQGKYLHLIDAPGYPDFVGAALEALNAVDTAVLVVSAATGLGVNTRRMASESARRGLARLIVLSKLDAEHINLAAVLQALQASFGKGCVLFNAPLGLGPSFHGVASVLEPPTPPPADCPVDLAAWRSQLIDAVVESDDALMEQYLSEGDLPAATLEAAVPKALAAGTLMPIFCTSAKKQLGVAELLDALARFALSPRQGPRRHVAAANGTGNGVAAELEVREDGPAVGQVFKTLTDKFVGNLTFVRLLSGRLTPDQQLVNLRTGKSARLNGMLGMQGKQQQPLTEAVAGDLIALAKVDGLAIGDTVAVDARAPRLEAPTFPAPMFGLAVEPKNRGDEQKISSSLHKLADEDPTFKVSHDVQTHEMVITGLSPLHLDVLQNRLKRRFDVEVVTHEPKVPYRETIAGTGEAFHKHKKQTGGRGQFAEVHMRVYPLPREITSLEQVQTEFATKDRFEKMRAVHYDPVHNFAFIDHIVGGTIPNQFIPAVEKGCKELLETGALAGYRIQDVAVEVHFGKYHDVDSSEAAFKMAGRLAFKKAFLAARPMLMEPVVKMEVTVPSQYTGAVLGDLNTKRAQVENQDSLPGDLAVITSRVPLAEVTRYAAQLGSISHGQGSYGMEFSHYDLVPPMVQQQIVSKAKKTDEEDE